MARIDKAPEGGKFRATAAAALDGVAGAWGAGEFLNVGVDGNGYTTQDRISCRDLRGGAAIRKLGTVLVPFSGLSKPTRYPDHGRIYRVKNDEVCPIQTSRSAVGTHPLSGPAGCQATKRWLEGFPS